MASQPQFGGYAAQVAPQRVATALPTATPEDYGAGIGDALSGAGNVAGQIATRERRLEAERDYDNQLIEKQLQFAQQQADFEILKNEDRQNGEPGHQGHTEAMRQWIDKAGEDFLGGIEHPGLRQKFAARVEEWKTGRVVEADAFERISTTKLRVTQMQTGMKLMANRARTLDPVAFGELQQEIATAERPEGVPADAFMELQHDAGRMAWASFLEGRPPDVRLAMLDSGLADAFLSPEEKDQLRRGGKIELRAEQIEAEEAAKDARVAARNEVEALEARVEAGDIPSSKEVADTIGRARAAGVPDADLIRFNTKFEDGQGMIAYSAGRDPTGARAARELARIDALDAAGKAKPEDLRLAEKLRPIAKARADEQGAALKDVYNSGPSGRLQAAGQILTLPSQDRQYAVAEAVSPGFGDVVMLKTEQLIAAATEGAVILKDRPELLKDRTGKDNSSTEYARIVGRVGRDLGEQYGSKYEVAKSLYASWAARTGKTSFDAAAFEKYVSVAFGGTVRRDGAMQGGLGTVNRHRVVLPDLLTQAEFDRTIARTDWSRARDREGNVVSRAFILGRMHPVRVGEDDSRMIYNMVDDAGRAVFGADRKPLPFVVPKAIR